MVGAGDRGTVLEKMFKELGELERGQCVKISEKLGEAQVKNTQ